MGDDVARHDGRRAAYEGDQQCLVREGNEAIGRLSLTLARRADRLELRCECGDPACLEPIAPTHAEYEAVRAYGSRFIVRPNHENPETAAVVSENERFAVVDVLERDARHQALARHTRHAWVDAVAEAGAPTRPPPADERSPA
jgi:hypothetical protein